MTTQREQVRLKPVNKRVKQLIKEHGDVWAVALIQERVICMNGGPGIFVVSQNKRHSRWMKPEDVETV